MNSERQLESSMWIMILLQTIGSVDLPGAGTRKMPAPRAYVAIIVLWTILGFFSGAWSRAAAGFGWLVVVATMVLPFSGFGTRAVDFLNSVASNFGITSSAQPVAFTPGTAVRPRSTPPSVQV